MLPASRVDIGGAEFARIQRRIVLRDGTPVLIRRLVKEDAALYSDFLDDIEIEDLRLRFFGSVHAFSPTSIDRLLNYNPAHAMAFAAVEERSKKILGIVRLHDDVGDAGAEFAVLVRSRLKDHGLGWALMTHVIEFAKRKGLDNIKGQVLAANAPMLTMCAELGFHITSEPGDPGVKAVILDVSGLDSNSVKHECH